MIPDQFHINTNPIAEAQAVVLLPQSRFTILTSRLIRMEYDPLGLFEDRPSQIFWFRKQPVPDYSVRRIESGCVITTEHLHLVYKGGQFNNGTLYVDAKDNSFSWQYGDLDNLNLGGTTRTLDDVCGHTKLEPGLVSRAGWAVIDDTHGLLFSETGWLETRDPNPEYQDLYFFGYGLDYLSCLRDYCLVSGAVPVLPRWALGNWWSRFWAYTQQELSDLMLDFKDHHVPLAICITDMDWHLEGWTGYTWNRELFPNPPGYLNFLHDLGLHTALNLHPASGVQPHEEMYAQMAHAMGIDPASQKAIKFDIENPTFAQAYFDILHHPLEDQGVDFWWMDWQQGNPSKLPGLNLLWWINHLHFLDLGRDGLKVSFIFSRWGGLGNHRYPIGFSGDTVVSWESLAFQPYFTATAANVNYGWWSHDIGGHMHGIEDPELYTRWVQFGVFSPILRLHSTNNPYHERRPWAFDTEIFRIAKDAMQLRHALIPYLYSMSWRNHVTGIPLILPMYYVAPEMDDAYACPNQYMFGSELLAAPVITPHDPDTRLARQVVWLPEGDWYDFFDGDYYPGGGWQAMYSSLAKIPIFARAGAIIPMGVFPSWGGVDNPNELYVHIFPGASNHFDLYEDDGSNNAYEDGRYARTRYHLDWDELEQSFSIDPVIGQENIVSSNRRYQLVFHSIQKPQGVHIYINNKLGNVEVCYSKSQHTLTLDSLKLHPTDKVVVKIRTQVAQQDHRVDQFNIMLKAFCLNTDIKRALSLHLAEIIKSPAFLEPYLIGLTKSQIRALIEVVAGCGVEHIQNAGEELIIMWNRFADGDFRYSISSENAAIFDPATRFSVIRGQVGYSQIYRPQKDFHKKTLVKANYHDLLKIRLSFGLDKVS